MISRHAIEVVTVLITNMLYRIFHAVFRLSAGHFDSVMFRAFTFHKRIEIRPIETVVGASYGTWRKGARKVQ